MITPKCKTPARDDDLFRGRFARDEVYDLLKRLELFNERHKLNGIIVNYDGRQKKPFLLSARVIEGSNFTESTTGTSHLARERVRGFSTTRIGATKWTQHTT